VVSVPSIAAVFLPKMISIEGHPVITNHRFDNEKEWTYFAMKQADAVTLMHALATYFGYEIKNKPIETGVPSGDNDRLPPDHAGNESANDD
jgi:hypothetical protein